MGKAIAAKIHCALKQHIEYVQSTSREQLLAAAADVNPTANNVLPISACS
jgi:hypothetical protein